VSKHDGQDDGDGIGAAWPYKSRGIFLNALGSIIANFISIGTLPVNIFYSVHELPKKLKMRYSFTLVFPHHHCPTGFYQSSSQL
jgi:hypothetical protein